MFERSFSPRSANKVAIVVTCLLAVTSLFAGSWRAGAQTAAVSQGERTVAPGTGVIALSRHTPNKVLKGTAIRVSHYNPEQKLRLALALQPPDMAGEEKFLQAITTKGSPDFHKFLSAAEWNKRFGPSVEQEQAVVDWAKSQGLTVTNRFDNRLLVDVEAPAGVIEKAFNVSLDNYKVDDEIDFSNDHDPSVPASLAIRSVMGLNSIQRMHGYMPLARKMKGPDYVAGPVFAKGAEGHTDGDPTKAPVKGAQRSEAGRKVNADGVTADSVTVDPSWVFDSEGYDFEALTTLAQCCNLHNDADGAPANTSIAIVSFGDFTNSDVLAFFNYYGYAAYFYRFVVNGQGGQPGVECSPGASGCPSIGMDDEIPGDVEFANAALNNHGSYLDTARTFVYEGANGYYNTYADLWNFVLSNGYAKVASTSYGSAEEDYDQGGFVNGTANGDIHPIFNAMVGQGMTLIAAAGDSGSAQDCGNAVQVNWPSADSDFVAAGGTGLNLDSDGNFVSETAWVGDTWSGACGDNWGGGGGGQSVYFPQPGWQNGLISGSTKRLVPDISLSADPDDTWEAYYYNGGWSRFDGTSIVAPELAGFFTMENSYLDYIGNKCGGSGTSACTPIGNPNPWIYYDASSGNGYHNPIYDVTSGCNSNDITAYYGLSTFCAGTGYDQATGWGSFNAMQLAWGINWELLPAYGQPSIAFSGPTTGVWYNTNQQVNWSVSDAGSSGLPAPGVAGFTQGWDTIPADPYSEPHGGSGNSFYDGPQFPFATGGCLAFNGNGCSGGSGQGCHTVVVEAWDNQGRTATQSYGPLCYDSVAPTISMTTNPNTSGTIWVDKSVTVTLNTADPGGSGASGIYKTYYAANSIACGPGSLGSCNVYTGPFTISAPGQTYIYFFTEDNAGNFSTETYQWVSIDETLPTATAAFSGTVSGTNIYGNIYDTPVSVTLNATAGQSGVQNIYYELDGGAQKTYSGPFTVSTVGLHSVQYWAVSVSGEVETTQLSSFTIYSQTTAALVATPNPSYNGQSVRMTATIAASLAGAGTPTGSVTFYNGATNLGTATVSNGVATLSTTTLPVGALTLQVTYTPTGSFVTTNSAPFDQTVQETTTTTITSTPNPATYGKGFTVTAKVAPSISGTPTGSVQFWAASEFLGSTIMSGGSASFTETGFNPGEYYIKAIYSGDSKYLTSTAAVLAQHVVAASQTIAFPVITAQTAASTLTLSATATSGLPVTFASSTPTVCTVSASTASLLTAGTCSITASQAGNSDYAAAMAVSHSFAISAANQTIAFAAIAAQPAASTLALTGSASSGLTLTYTSTTPTVCTVSGSSASLLIPGTCSITASQPGNATYNTASPVSETFAVNKAGQTITFPKIASQSEGTTLSLVATASSGLPVAFRATTPAVCTVSGTTATFIADGTCSIDVSQAGNATYSAAPAVGTSFAVLPGQTIAFPAITGNEYAGTTLTLLATSNSGLAVKFASTTASVCAVSGTTATLLTGGTCSVTATQPGNSTYGPAVPVSQSFTVLAPTQTITFPAIAGTEVAATTLGLTATANSGLPVTFSSTTPTVCSVSGTTASLLAGGTCTIAANQAGNSSYGPAPTVTQSFTVAKASQTITFPKIATQTEGTPLSLVASASSGLAVAFRSTTTAVCTVSGSTASFIAAGTCSIDVGQAGNATYAAAPAVGTSFIVKP